MKKLREIMNALKSENYSDAEDLNGLIRQYVLYSPKMPLRLHQEELLASAERFSLEVYDTYFTGENIPFSVFKWGAGTYKILLTHGWASKAADFYELITALREIDNLEIIAFDAPGNGSSASELSSLILYADAVRSILSNYATPDFLVGHSLGGMANMMVIQESGLSPKRIISIAPLIRLKENFEQSMQGVGVSEKEQEAFFRNFEKEFLVPAHHFNLAEGYHLHSEIDHFVAYDPDDHISPYSYLKELLDKHPAIQAKAYPESGHYKILKSGDVIQDIVDQINQAMQ